MTNTAQKLQKRAPVAVDLSHSELELACAIFGKLSVGGDVRQLASTAAGRSLYTKFVRARDQARGQ